MSANNYLKMLEAINVATVFDVDITDCYQGDHAAIVAADDGWGADENDRHGLLIIGYGSCSGCDEYEAAESDGPAQLLDLLQRVFKRIKWFDNYDQCRAYVLSHDAELEWYGHEENWKKFVQRIREVTEDDYDSRKFKAESD